jgi:Protein of unknown function (DUF1588)/Protein of unknown function (DUF1592)/Protein of unknown function (DUF1585)
MLADPKAKPVVRKFFMEWLRSDEIREAVKDTVKFPQFAAMQASMQEETGLFFEESFFGSDSSLGNLFLGKFTYVDAKLAPLYGVPAPTTGFQRIALDGEKRLGILTQPSFLAVNAKSNQSNPVLRGLFVREHVLCGAPPPPPANLMVVAPDIVPGVSTRQRFAQHSTNAACSGCHRLMDPIGLGLENYDPIGAYRERDEGQVVDSSGNVLDSDVEGAFIGAKGLATKLASSEQVADCVALQAFRFTQGRVESTQDACSLYRLRKSFRQSRNLKELFVQLTMTDAFLYRRAQ